MGAPPRLPPLGTFAALHRGKVPLASERDTGDFWDQIGSFTENPIVQTAVNLPNAAAMGAGLAIEEGRAALTGLPSRAKLSPEGIADYAADVGSRPGGLTFEELITMDLPGSSYSVPDAGQIATEGIVMAARGADLDEPGFAPPSASVPEAIGRGALGFGMGMVTDPIMGAYLRAGQVTSAAAKGLQAAKTADQTTDALKALQAAKGTYAAAAGADLATGAAALPGIVGGGIETGQAAIQEYDRSGLSPQFAEQATQSALSALAIGMVGKDAVDYKRAHAELLADGLKTKAEKGTLNTAEVLAAAGVTSPEMDGTVPVDLQIPEEPVLQQETTKPIAEVPTNQLAQPTKPIAEVPTNQLAPDTNQIAEEPTLRDDEWADVDVDPDDPLGLMDGTTPPPDNLTTAQAEEMYRLAKEAGAKAPPLDALTVAEMAAEMEPGPDRDAFLAENQAALPRTNIITSPSEEAAMNALQEEMGRPLGGLKEAAVGRPITPEPAPTPKDQEPDSGVDEAPPPEPPAAPETPTPPDPVAEYKQQLRDEIEWEEANLKALERQPTANRSEIAFLRQTINEGKQKLADLENRMAGVPPAPAPQTPSPVPAPPAPAAKKLQPGDPGHPKKHPLRINFKNPPAPDEVAAAGAMGVDPTFLPDDLKMAENDLEFHNNMFPHDNSPWIKERREALIERVAVLQKEATPEDEVARHQRLVKGLNLPIPAEALALADENVDFANRTALINLIEDAQFGNLLNLDPIQRAKLMPLLQAKKIRLLDMQVKERNKNLKQKLDAVEGKPLSKVETRELNDRADLMQEAWGARDTEIHRRGKAEAKRVDDELVRRAQALADARRAPARFQVAGKPELRVLLRKTRGSHNKFIGRVEDENGNKVFAFRGLKQLQSEAKKRGFNIEDVPLPKGGKHVSPQLAAEVMNYTAGQIRIAGQTKIGRPAVEFLDKVAEDHGITLPKDQLVWINPPGGSAGGAIHNLYEIGIATKGHMKGKKLLFRVGATSERLPSQVFARGLAIPLIDDIRYKNDAKQNVQIDIVEWVPSYKDVTGRDNDRKFDDMRSELGKRVRRAGGFGQDLTGNDGNARFMEIPSWEYNQNDMLHVVGVDGKHYKLVVSDYGAIASTNLRAEPGILPVIPEDKVPLVPLPGEPTTREEAETQAKEQLREVATAPPVATKKTSVMLEKLRNYFSQRLSKADAAGIRTLKAGGVGDFLKRGWTSLIGSRIDVSSPEAMRRDLAFANRINRSPFEVGHVVAIGHDGKVIDHQAWTSVMPNTVRTPEYLDRIMKEWSKRDDIAHVFTMHNHPGGYPGPSGQDIRTVAGRRSAHPKLNYHGEVITDHQFYGFVEGDSGLGTEDAHTIDRAEGKDPRLRRFEGKYLEAVGQDDPFFRQAIPHSKANIYDHSVEEIAMLAKSTFGGDNRSVILLYASNSGTIRRVESVPMKTFINQEFMKNHLRGSANMEGGSIIMAMADGPLRASFKEASAQLIDSGSLMYGFSFDFNRKNMVHGVGEGEVYADRESSPYVFGRRKNFGTKGGRIGVEEVDMAAGIPGLEPGDILFAAGEQTFPGPNYRVVNLGLENLANAFAAAGMKKKWGQGQGNVKNNFTVIDPEGRIVQRFQFRGQAEKLANQHNAEKNMRPISTVDEIKLANAAARESRVNREKTEFLPALEAKPGERGEYTVEKAPEGGRGWLVKNPSGETVANFMIKNRAEIRAQELTKGQGRRGPGVDRMKEERIKERADKRQVEQTEDERIFLKGEAQRAARARAEARGGWENNEAGTGAPLPNVPLTPSQVAAARGKARAEEVIAEDNKNKDNPINVPVAKSVGQIKKDVDAAKPISKAEIKADPDEHRPPKRDINKVRQDLDPDVAGRVDAMGDAIHDDLWRTEVQHWEDVDPVLKKIFNLRSPEDFVKYVKKRGRPLTQGEMKAFRMVAIDEAQKSRLAFEDLQIARQGGNAEEIRAADEAYSKQIAWEIGVQMELANRKTEAARILNSLRETIGGPLDPELTFMGRLLSALKAKGLKPKDVADLAHIYKTDPAAFPDALRNALEPTWSQMILEGWKAGLVSGPATHLANAASNAIFRGLREVENFIATGIDWARAGITGTERQRFLGEMTAAYGGIKAIMGGPSGAAAQLVSGLKAIRDLQDLPKPFPGSALDLEQVGAIPGRFGQAYRTPFKMLELGDTFFKHMSGGLEVYRRAYRMARMSGAGTTNLTQRTQAIADTMLEVLRTGPKHPKFETYKKEFAEIQKVMKRDTFQADLGPIGQAFQQLARHPIGGVLLPFVKTPANILKETVLRTPGAILYTDFRKSMKSLLNGDEKAGEAAEALAKVVLGSVIGAAAAAAAYEDLITGGGPVDPKLQENKRRTGWEPYSLHIGNQYISYQRFEPLSSVLGLAADLSEAVKAGDTNTAKQHTQKLIGSIADNLTSKTFLAGLEGFFTFWHDPVRYGDRWVKQLEGSVVPNIVGATARAIDPVYRETDALTGEAAMAKIPGLSKTLPPSRTPTGEVRMRRGNALERFAAPYQRTSENPDPAADVYRELDRIGYVPSTIGKTISVRGKKLPLTDEERTILADAREKATQRLRRVIRDPGFRRLPDSEKDPRTDNPRWLSGPRETKQKVLERLYRRYQEEANNKVKRMAYQRWVKEKRAGT